MTFEVRCALNDKFERVILENLELYMNCQRKLTLIIKNYKKLINVIKWILKKIQKITQQKKT